MFRVFAISVPRRTLLLAAVDYLVLAGSFIAAIFVLVPISPWMFLMYESGLEMVAFVAAAGSLGLYLTNTYARVRVTSRTALALDLCQAMGFLFLIKATIMYVNPNLALPRAVVLLGSIISLVGLFVWRTTYSSILRHAFLNDRVLFIGHRPEMEEIAHRVRERPQLGLTVVGYIGGPPCSASAAAKRLGDFEAVDEIIGYVRPDRIVVGADLREPGFNAAMFRLRPHRVHVERVGPFYERVMGRISSAELRPSSVILDRELQARPRSLALQSIYTNLLALVATLVLGLPMLLIAAAIRLSSRQRALELHARVGLNGVPFNLYRFHCHNREGRLTGIGRWLRRRRLDYLPQLLNVFRGEMSLIGPEPHRPEFAAVLSGLIPYYQERHIVRPGLIGWTQLNIDSQRGLTDEMVLLEYDLYYIKHISLSLDLYIVLTNLRHTLAGISGSDDTQEAD